MKTKGIGTLVIITMIVIIAIAGIGGYFVLKGEEGPAVKLALKSSELGPSWEGDKLESWYEGRQITQNFFKTIDVDENTKLKMLVYQNIAVYPSVEAALESEDFKYVRESSSESIDLPFWSEAYAAPCAGGDVGIVLRKSNIVVILQYVEFDIREDPMTGEFTREEQKEITQEREVENFLCELAEIIQSKIIKTGGG